MSHKTMVDGVSYEIGGGKTLVNGTAYSIDKGKTLVGGTAYEVGFGDGMATLTITTKSSSSSDNKPDETYISINADCTPFPSIPNYIVNPWKIDCSSNTTYTVTVPEGTIINCRAKTYNSRTDYGVILNGVQVSDKDYDYIVSGDATIELYASSISMTACGRIKITET